MNPVFGNQVSHCFTLYSVFLFKIFFRKAMATFVATVLYVWNSYIGACQLLIDACIANAERKNSMAAPVSCFRQDRFVILGFFFQELNCDFFSTYRFDLLIGKRRHAVLKNMV